MIVYHESEYYDSPLSWEALRILQNFLPREAYDQLLYRRSASVRLHTRNPQYSIPKRVIRLSISGVRIHISETTKSKEKVQEVRALAI